MLGTCSKFWVDNFVNYFQKLELHFFTKKYSIKQTPKVTDNNNLSALVFPFCFIIFFQPWTMLYHICMT